MQFYERGKNGLKISLKNFQDYKFQYRHYNLLSKVKIGCRFQKLFYDIQLGLAHKSYSKALPKHTTRKIKRIKTIVYSIYVHQDLQKQIWKRMNVRPSNLKAVNKGSVCSRVSVGISISCTVCNDCWQTLIFQLVPETVCFCADTHLNQQNSQSTNIPRGAVPQYRGGTYSSMNQSQNLNN